MGMFLFVVALQAAIWGLILRSFVEIVGGSFSSKEKVLQNGLLLNKNLNQLPPELFQQHHQWAAGFAV